MLDIIKRNKFVSDILFILWAGGAALLSYSLVYALRKPFTAAEFEGLTVWGMDYKIAVTIVQILGYLTAKFAGIKIISELRREGRLGFILVSVGVAEMALVFFAVLPVPWNIFAMFFNGLALGCMWGVIFSFIEGRRETDLLASLLGISMVVSSGTAKSVGLYVMGHFQVDEFWMPAAIGACALPLLCLLGYCLHCLPMPTAEDIRQKSERCTLDGKQRWALFRQYMPFLLMLFVANLMLVVVRDIKEDFLVKIFDVEGNGYSSWIFAQLDSVVTLIILCIFGLMIFVKNNFKALLILLGMVIAGMGAMSYVSMCYDELQLSPLTWLFIQSLCLYIAYLSFQTIFFDRFIACFRIQGNVGFFIVLIDFIGYSGTVLVLMVKEFFSPEIDWLVFYNHLAGFVGMACCLLFAGAFVYLVRRHKCELAVKTKPDRSIAITPTFSFPFLNRFRRGGAMGRYTS